MEQADRQVCETIFFLGALKTEVRISTVFLGIDHGYRADLPILFETMIFGGKHDCYQTRCSTWAEAEKMHAEAKALVHRDQIELVKGGR